MSEWREARSSRGRKSRLGWPGCASVGLVVVLVAGIGYNASQSWSGTLSFLEAEEAAWGYIQEHDIAGIVLPVLPSDSMGADLHVNQLAVIELIPFEEVEVGQIAVFREPGQANPTAHTVEHILPDGRLQTRGRANLRFDPLVTPEMFIGVVVETFEYRAPKRGLGNLG